MPDRRMTGQVQCQPRAQTISTRGRVRAVVPGMLVEELWGEPTPACDQAAAVAVMRLRQALDADGADVGAAR
jgi:hypothetical protein